MISENALHEHYALVLGLSDSWLVTSVVLDPVGKALSMTVARSHDAPVLCPECKQICKVYDHSSTRRWRHLDMMQFTTTISGRIPRSNCPTHGVLQVHVPWAGPHSRFTLFLNRTRLICFNWSRALIRLGVI